MTVTLRRLSLAVLALAAILTIAPLAAPTAAWANGANFHSVSDAVDNAGALVVSFDERGLGNDNVDYLLTAHATAVFACINGGRNHPQAANKETINAEVSAGASFEPKNGRVQASLSAGPPSAGGFACPNGQHLELASVAYTNVVLTDLSNAVSVSADDVSRVFFAV